MYGNYANNTLNPFSVPPPNFNQRPSSSWGKESKSNQNLPKPNNILGSGTSQQLQSNFPSQINGKYLYLQTQGKKEQNGQIHSVGNGEMSSISVPPPPLPPTYMGAPKVPSIYTTTTQHMYPNRVPTALPYQGAVAYVPIPAETYAAHHSYYPPLPPPPVPHNPPPPPPPTTGHYSTTSSQRNFYYKRKSPAEIDFLKKMNNKKKKKSLSQNIPQRKDWSVEDAVRAIDLEKEYNKRNRSASLIIKFPDTELNRDIVARFHPSIDTVHFQQPSTPRFCFVTLKEGINAEEVIEKLNKTRFGQGYLSVEYKKDREEDLNIGPEDIDPLTLYVGNLAQEVMKEDMVKIYPKHKRVDIGYAKKMKFTRYAFVSFKNVDDSIEAFKKTHATQLYSKSLIVRFRRLHGTVGMPGEPKPQLPQKHSDHRSHDDDYAHEETSSNDSRPQLSPWDMVDVSQWDSDRSIKLESIDDVTDEEIEEVDDMFGCLPDIAQKIFEEIERQPINQIGPPKNVAKVPIKKDEKHLHNSTGILSPIPSLHFNEETDEKKPVISEGLLLQNSQDKKLSVNGKNLVSTRDEVKPSYLVDQKPSLSQINPNLSPYSRRSGPIHKPFVELKKEPKEEIVSVDEEKIEVESTKLSESNSFLYVQVKTEVEDNKSTTQTEIKNINTSTTESITNEFKQENVGSVNVTETNCDMDMPLVSVKDEPVEPDEQQNEENDNDNMSDDEFDFGNLLSNLDEKSEKLKKLKEMVL